MPKVITVDFEGDKRVVSILDVSTEDLQESELSFVKNLDSSMDGNIQFAADPFFGIGNVAFHKKGHDLAANGVEKFKNLTPTNSKWFIFGPFVIVGFKYGGYFHGISEETSEEYDDDITYVNRLADYRKSLPLSRLATFADMQ